jgi:redox-sensitive bicupin YhaK (pirin superfamily)
MSISLRRAKDRGHANHGWLDTWHSFSFADYLDPRHMGFRALRVINEDLIAPGAGFPTHGHRDMEIITYVTRGAVAHQDSSGASGITRAGEVQYMCAGTGIRHSEYNASEADDLKLLQIWILPDGPGHRPDYAQSSFAPDRFSNRLGLVASPDGADGSLPIHQDMRLWAAKLEAGLGASLPLAPGRGAWVQVVEGSVTVQGETLNAGDGAAITDMAQLDFTAAESCEFLVFDLA